MCNDKLSHRNRGVRAAMLSTLSLLDENEGQMDGHRSIKGFAEEIDACLQDEREQISPTHVTRISRLVAAIELLIERHFIKFDQRSRCLVWTRAGKRAYAQALA